MKPREGTPFFPKTLIFQRYTQHIQTSRVGGQSLWPVYAYHQVAKCGDNMLHCSLKKCGCRVTKGLTALATEALVAGRALGLQETLLAEFQALPLFRTIERSVPGMPPKSYRWVGEMEEIARTFADLGLPA